MTAIFEQASEAVEAGRTRTRANLMFLPDQAAVSRALLFVLVLSVWLVGRPYAGISHDARIYIGRAVANLHPENLGREPVFAFDGQTQLSGYSLLCGPLVRLFGPELAAFVLTATTLMAWLAAAVGLARHLVTRRLVPAAIVCAAMLPATYGPFTIFSYGEAFAVPRGVAEVGVLLALICLLEGRTLLAFACVGLAAFMHVPTAAAGAGVAFLFAVEATPALWLLAPLGGAALAASGWLHVGPAKTLFLTYDPAWLAVMKIRNPFLFVGDWSADAWSHAIVPGATVLIAATFAQGRVRFLLRASVLVAVLGVASSYLLGDLANSILVVQLQLWRALWLVKALGVIVLPFCALRLWSEGRADSRCAFFLLAAAWCVLGSPWLAIPLSIVAAGLVIVGRILGPMGLRSSLVRGAAILAVILAAESFIGSFYFAAKLVSSAVASGWQLTPKALVDFNVFTLPLAATALALSIKPPQFSPRANLAALAICATLAATCATLCWAPPNPTKTVLASRARLSAMIGDVPNGVVWVGNDTAPWVLVERPTWVNSLQGTVAAFSRPLAMQWDLRSRQLVASGLGALIDRDPRATSPGVERSPAEVSQGIQRLCRVDSGPSVIVAPQDLVRWFHHGQAALWSPASSGPNEIARSPNSARAHARRAEFTVVRCVPWLASAN